MYFCPVSTRHSLHMGTASSKYIFWQCSQEETLALQIRTTQHFITGPGNCFWLVLHQASGSFRFFLWLGFLGKWWEHFNHGIWTHSIHKQRTLLCSEDNEQIELACTYYLQQLHNLKRSWCKSITTAGLPWTMHPVCIWGDIKWMAEEEWLQAKRI